MLFFAKKYARRKNKDRCAERIKTAALKVEREKISKRGGGR